jgi:hypothetical protein
MFFTKTSMLFAKTSILREAILPTKSIITHSLFHSITL